MEAEAGREGEREGGREGVRERGREGESSERSILKSTAHNPLELIKTVSIQS